MFDLFSIYIHIPFCVKKCSYCDFFSCADTGLISEYVESLLKEIQYRAEPWQKVHSIYFGGGTPSLLDASHVEKIIETVDQSFVLSGDTEMTLEVNPASADKAKLSAFKAFGINRLSIGVQSFNDDKLAFLDRIHSADQAFEAVRNARRAGFKDIGIDLIYGLGVENREIWQEDLEKAVQLEPEHMSCYMLTIEPGTPLHASIEKGQAGSMPRSEVLEMFKQTSVFLEDHGYDHYEISNFAKGKENRSKHNAHYWGGGAYLGFGPGAHSFDKETRSWNQPDIKNYTNCFLQGTFPIPESEVLTDEQKMTEFILLKLRTIEGINLKDFRDRLNVSFQEKFAKQIDAVLEQNLGKMSDDSFFLTLDGRMRLDSIVESFCDQVL